MATRALQIDLLMTPVIDPTTSAVANGYTVYFYSAGTTTAKNVWTESGKSNAYTSVTLGDGNWESGTAQVYGDGIYKITIKNSDSTTVLEWDNVKIQSNAFNTVSTNQNYTATAEDDIILVDTSAGDITLSLATVTGFERPVTVKKIDSSDNTLTVDPYSTQTIDDSSTVAMSLEYDTLILYPDTSSSTWRRGYSPSLGTFVNDSNGEPVVSSTTFQSSYITAWESVGPTGSGEDNTWGALDSVDTRANWIKVRVSHSITVASATASTLYYSIMYARKEGSTTDSTDTMSQVRGYGQVNTVPFTAHSSTELTIPVNNRVFEIKNSNTGSPTVGQFIWLVGWGFNS